MITRSIEKEKRGEEKNKDWEKNQEYSEENQGEVGLKPAPGKLEDEKKIFSEMYARGLAQFIPDMIFRNIVNNYQNALKLYGETFLRLVTGYDPKQLKKDIRFREIQEKIKERLRELREKFEEEGLVSKEGVLTENALKVSIIYILEEEINKLVSSKFGKNIMKERSKEGIVSDYDMFNKNYHYRDIAIRPTLKVAIKRGHKKIMREDLRAKVKKDSGELNIIFALDASGSMKGEKIIAAKKAFIALAYVALKEKNKVGFVVFSSKVKHFVRPTNDFFQLVKELQFVKAEGETDIVAGLQKSLELLENVREDKHIILISDIETNVGESPVEEMLEKVYEIRNEGITMSIVGIRLKDETREIAKKIVEVTNGRLYEVKDPDNLDLVVLEDYLFEKRK